MTRELWKLVLGVAVALTLGLGTASADSLAFGLGQHDFGSPYTGPFGTVSIVMNGTNQSSVTVTFTGATQTISGTTYTYLFSDGSSAALNTNGTATASSFSSTNSGIGFSTPSYTQTSPTPHATQSVDGFGKFNMVIDNKANPNGATSAALTISFTLTKDSGTWANAAAVLADNDKMNVAAAHIYVFKGTATSINAANGALVTGYAADNGSTPPPQSPVPEPASMLLMAGLFGGLGVAGYRRKRASATA